MKQKDFFKSEDQSNFRFLLKFLESVFDNLSAFIAVLDRDGTVVLVNEAGTELAPGKIPLFSHIEIGDIYPALCGEDKYDYIGVEGERKKDKRIQGISHEALLGKSSSSEGHHQSQSDKDFIENLLELKSGIINVGNGLIPVFSTTVRVPPQSQSQLQNQFQPVYDLVSVTAAGFDIRQDRFIVVMHKLFPDIDDIGIDYLRCKDRFLTLFDNIDNGVAIYRAVDSGDDFIFTDYNAAGSGMDNVRAEDVIGRRVTEVFPGVKSFGLLDLFRRVWLTGKPERHPPSLYKDNLLEGWRDNYVSRLSSGEIMAIYSDKTLQKKSEDSLKLSRIVYQNSREAIIITDLDGNILEANPAFTAITGYSHQEIISKNTSLMKSGRDGFEFYQRFWDELKSSGKWQGEIWDRRKNGEIFPKWLSVSTVYDDSGTPVNYIGIFTDLSVIKKAEEDINRLYNYDILTKLPNRSLFYDRLKQSMEKSKLDGKKIAVILMDLDRTSRVNESYGISYGDKLLIGVADRLRSCLENAESLSRLVSDRFIFFLSRLETYDPIAATIQKIRDIFEQGFMVNDTHMFISTSIGVTIFPNDGKKPNELIKNAEIALNHAKLSGPNNFQFFSGEMTTKAFERMQLEIAVRTALEKGELIVYYQPKVDISNGRITGMEALLRWNHPLLGMVSPVRFIPIAEASDIILSIGEWVLRQACIAAEKIVRSGHPGFVVGVNLSAKQLKQQNFVDKVREILQETSLPPESLDLELTESMLFDNIERNITFMEDLKALGVSLSIDDFGTGYSSLSYLKSFPVDTLKIDRSFVMDIPEDKDDMAITSTIISMAHSLGLEVVAEGVETKVQAAFLKERGCIQVQGYLFSPPVPEEKLLELLKKGFSV